MANVETTIMSEKGQVVIPRRIRKHLKIKPKTRFAVYANGDTIVMRAFVLPDLEREWSKIFDASSKKGLKISEKDVYAEAQAHRMTKQKQR